MIRRATYNDIFKITDLLKQVCLVHHQGREDLFKGGNSAKYTQDELMHIIDNDNTPIFVYADGSDNVLGYAFCKFIQHTDDNILTDIKTLYIDDLCVDENCRGKHIGTLLYEYVLDFARQNSCYNVTLNVWACNKSAIEFYKKLGLKVQKIGMENIV